MLLSLNKISDWPHLETVDDVTDVPDCPGAQLEGNYLCQPADAHYEEQLQGETG